jgi:hypothetical protein
VVVAVTLENCSKVPQQVEDLLAPDYGFLQVWLTPPSGGPRVACRPSVMRDARGKRPRTLAPGARLHAWVPLYACADGWILSPAGAYRLNAEYAVDGARLSAAPASFTVAPAGATNERAAADLLMNKATARMLLTGRGEEEGSRRLSAFLRQHPESRLAPYARCALGIASTQERFDPSTKDFRKADCPRAVDLLGPAVGKIADPFLAATATRALSHCLRTLGRAGEAEQALRDYSRTHPRGRELPGVREVLEGSGKSS